MHASAIHVAHASHEEARLVTCHHHSPNSALRIQVLEVWAGSPRPRRISRSPLPYHKGRQRRGHPLLLLSQEDRAASWEWHVTYSNVQSSLDMQEVVSDHINDRFRSCHFAWSNMIGAAIARRLCPWRCADAQSRVSSVMAIRLRCLGNGPGGCFNPNGCMT